MCFSLFVLTAFLIHKMFQERGEFSILVLPELQRVVLHVPTVHCQYMATRWQHLIMIRINSQFWVPLCCSLCPDLIKDNASLAQLHIHVLIFGMLITLLKWYTNGIRSATVLIKFWQSIDHLDVAEGIAAAASCCCGLKKWKYLSVLSLKSHLTVNALTHK